MILMTSDLVVPDLRLHLDPDPGRSGRAHREVLAVLGLQRKRSCNFDAGYASAIGLTMSFFVGIVIGIFIVLRRRGWEI